MSKYSKTVRDLINEGFEPAAARDWLIVEDNAIDGDGPSHRNYYQRTTPDGIVSGSKEDATRFTRIEALAEVSALGRGWVILQDDSSHD